MNLKDKTVIITGAGSGIGRALAVGFCKDGANVVGIGRTEKDLAQTSALCAQRMGYITGDVSSKDDVERLFKFTKDRYGKLDILVNNAAIYPKIGFLNASHEEWAKVFDVNFFGLAFCCRKALNEMTSTGYGRIINLASFAWKNPLPESSAYSISKGAVHHLTKALASEIDRNQYPNILVNEVSPGIVKTRMSDNGIDPQEVYPQVRFVANLPKNGPTGELFIKNEIFVEHYGMKRRIKDLLNKLSGGLIKR